METARLTTCVAITHADRQHNLVDGRVNFLSSKVLNWYHKGPLAYGKLMTRYGWGLDKTPYAAKAAYALSGSETSAQQGD